MKVRMEGNELSIRVPLTETKTSKSGKSIVLASTRGQQVVGKWEGRPVLLQLNVIQPVHGAESGEGNVIEIETGRGYRPKEARMSSRKKGQGRVTSTGRKSISPEAA